MRALKRRVTRHHPALRVARLAWNIERRRLRQKAADFMALLDLCGLIPAHNAKQNRRPEEVKRDVRRGGGK